MFNKKFKNFGTSWLTRMPIAPILLLNGQKKFRCGPVANVQTEKFNFDTNFITNILIIWQALVLMNRAI
jgi:hypothetical protein